MVSYTAAYPNPQSPHVRGRESTAADGNDGKSEMKHCESGSSENGSGGRELSRGVYNRGTRPHLRSSHRRFWYRRQLCTRASKQKCPYGVFVKQGIKQCHKMVLESKSDRANSGDS